MQILFRFNYAFFIQFGTKIFSIPTIDIFKKECWFQFSKISPSAFQFITILGNLEQPLESRKLSQAWISFWIPILFQYRIEQLDRWPFCSYLSNKILNYYSKQSNDVNKVWSFFYLFYLCLIYLLLTIGNRIGVVCYPSQILAFYKDTAPYELYKNCTWITALCCHFLALLQEAWGYNFSSSNFTN